MLKQKCTVQVIMQFIGELLIGTTTLIVWIHYYNIFLNFICFVYKVFRNVIKQEKM